MASNSHKHQKLLLRGGVRGKTYMCPQVHYRHFCATRDDDKNMCGRMNIPNVVTWATLSIGASTTNAEYK